MQRLIKVHVNLICKTCSPQHILGTLWKLLLQEGARLVLYIHHHVISCALANCNYEG